LPISGHPLSKGPSRILKANILVIISCPFSTPHIPYCCKWIKRRRKIFFYDFYCYCLSIEKLIEPILDLIKKLFEIVNHTSSCRRVQSVILLTLTITKSNTTIYDEKELPYGYHPIHPIHSFILLGIIFYFYVNIDIST